jgi:hypothetical protein
MILLTDLFITAVSHQLILSAVGLALVILLFVSKNDFWLVISSVFLIVFQTFIFIDWEAAKYWTFINSILLVSIIIAFQRRRFGTMVRSEVIEVFKSDLIREPVITLESLRDLPPIVQKWLIRSNVIGKPPIQTLCVRQKGAMRLKADGNWLPFRAEQFINADNQGFIWNATVNSGFLIPIHARDKYLHRHGNMLINAFYTIPIADSSGPEIDQGTLMRFLAEIIWFPTAALAGYIRWEYLTETRARATIENGVTSVSGIFSFDLNGDIAGFEGLRYRDVSQRYTLQKWTIAVKSHRVFGDFRIADKSEVTWHQGDVPFTWLRLELSKVKYSFGKPETQPAQEKGAEIGQQLELK